MSYTGMVSAIDRRVGIAQRIDQRIAEAPAIDMDARATLKANMAALSEKDQEFARSLLGNKPTAKVLEWIDKMAQRAEAAAKTAASPELAKPAEMVANVAGIVDLIDRGGQHLKHPKIAFQAGSMALMLSIAGDRARHPGSINVTDTEKGFGAKTWFGRIHPDGRWEPSGRIDQETAEKILAALREFAADPAGVARRYGKLFGACCFCRIPLTDPRSVAAGYGEICAERYSLPWG